MKILAILMIMALFESDITRASAVKKLLKISIFDDPAEDKNTPNIVEILSLTERRKTEIEIDAQATVAELKKQWAEKVKISLESQYVRMARIPFHAMKNIPNTNLSDAEILSEVKHLSEGVFAHVASK